MIARVQPWWEVRTPRERLLLGLLAGLALVALLLVVVVRPLQAARAQSLADIRTYQTLAARLRAPIPTGPTLTGDPATSAASSAATYALVPRAVVAEGAGVRVTLADAPYESVLRWLAALETTSRLRVARLTVARGLSPGLVRAEAVLAP